MRDKKRDGVCIERVKTHTVDVIRMDVLMITSFATHADTTHREKR